MRRILSIVWVFGNLLAGLRLTLPAPVGRRSFHVSADQAILLMLLSAGMAVLVGYLTMLVAYPSDTVALESYPYALTILGSRCLLALFLYYVIARTQRAPHKFWAIVVAMAAAAVFLQVFGAVIFWLSHHVLPELVDTYALLVACWALVLLWAFAAALRALRRIFGAGFLRAGVLAAVIVAESAAANWAMPFYPWYPQRLESEAQAQLPPIDTERTYCAQHDRLAGAIAALAPDRPGIADLYFVGLAGTSSQDVFLKEARSAQALFDERFDARGRSLLLVNNRRRPDDFPIASVSNLRVALAGVAGKMSRKMSCSSI
jgi:hypothetical protein